MSAASTTDDAAPRLPLIVQPDALAPLLPAPALLPVMVCTADQFKRYHLPGSVLIEPTELVCGIPPATGKLPDAARLSAVFSRIGLTPDAHVIAADAEGGGWAGRLLWTLDVLGHRHYSLLDGGLIAWYGDKLPAESGLSAPVATDYQATVQPGMIADMQQVKDALNDEDTVIWDARAREEFDGRKPTAARNGHIPGAVNLDWLEMMDRERNLRLKPLPALREKLEKAGISTGRKVITHCQTHHRSGLTWFVGKALGLDIRAYDGSWSEWGNDPRTPVET